MISAGWPGGRGERGGERDGRGGADRALVLAADDDRDVAGQAQVEDPPRLRESGARRLDAHDPHRALVERAVDVREADAALVAAQRHVPALRQPQPARAIVDRDRLLDRPHAELDERVTRPDGVVVAPAAVGVHVEIGVGQGVAHRTDRRDVERRCPPHLDLERVDPEAFVHLDGLVGHLRRLAQRHHVRRGHVVGETAQQRVARHARGSCRSDPRPRDRPPRGRRSCRSRSRTARRRARLRSGSTPTSASLSAPPTVSTIDAWVSP